MSEISPIGHSQPTVGRITGQRPAATEAPASIDRIDSVEVSPVAHLLAKLHDLPIRSDLVNQVKAEIAASTYETSDKLDKAVESLSQDLYA